MAGIRLHSRGMNKKIKCADLSALRIVYIVFNICASLRSVFIGRAYFIKNDLLGTLKWKTLFKIEAIPNYTQLMKEWPTQVKVN